MNTKKANTRANLLTEARRMFWTRGYSNVPVREIARAVGVDVALISRYFGSKKGLFLATLETAFDEADLADGSLEHLMDGVIAAFVNAPRDGSEPSIVQLILMNSNEDEVGQIVRDLHAKKMQSKLAALIGDEAKAALFMAGLLGLSVAEKTLRIKGIATPGTDEYVAQLRHVMQTALTFGD